MADSIKLILRLLYQPVTAMSAILDRGSLLSASLSVVAVSFALQYGASNWIRLPFYGPLLVLAVAYVPGILLLCGVLGRLGGFVVSFQRDYSPLLTCTAMAWAAANLPLAVAGWISPPEILLVLAGLAYLYFAVLMFFAIRTVFGAGNGASLAAVLLSWIPLVAAAFLWVPLRFLMGWIASRSSYSSPGIFSPASFRTWARSCATGSISAACWKRPRSIRTMARRNISSD